ncbi:regulatory protein RecX [Acetobacter fallax]|uniref:Regulatory protein RecX n=1 Tax=Acetobacter fallax TaxID=1737473 RepID=A0ABX0K9Z1_9PROT|nr:RecX family transcriptional regulator [Acetobacter fallax]NHO33234.1 regulatory protein RecX [Acetobacter fallax]NHO36854.1 regulatory protein RecX [Acetobacter fallax]
MATRTPRLPRPAGPPPDQAALREAALAHLARFATTEQGLTQVLERRIGRWGRRAAEDGLASDEIADITARLMPLATVVARTMVELGAVDDSSFARARAARLTRSGQSRRSVEARLAAKGIAPSTVGDVLDETLGDDERARDSELGAALVFARKRRAGPFSTGETLQKDESRILAAFARAGFTREIAFRALAMDRDEAEERIITLKDAL